VYQDITPLFEYTYWLSSVV